MPRRAILEREHELAQVAAAARSAAAGEGCVALVYGEAGIGKSSLVEAVRGQIPAEARMLVGRCDDLATARTLGPFRDLIGSVGTELATVLRDSSDRERLLSALRAELDWISRPTVLAIEDVHWADDATLDVLRYLVRRIAGLPVVLLLTYRDDELTDDHPLHQLLELVTSNGRRLPLRRLSREAVGELSMGRSADADVVFAVTSGNPFFVSEVLASSGDGLVSRTVVAAVLARLSHLDERTRDAVERLSVVPTEIDLQLVDALVPDGMRALAPAEERGLLTVTRRQVAFRHELTRRAIADAMPSARRAALSENVLIALAKQPGADLARLMHHAAEAGNHAAVVRYGPDAARSSAATGAHREAVAHYALVLEHGTAFPPAERAALLEAYAVECHTVGWNERAETALQQAIELRRTLGEPVALGAGLRWLSRIVWFSGDVRAAEAAADEAIAVLERTDATKLLALAYSNRAQIHNLGLEAAAAVTASVRAVELARPAGDLAILSHALNNRGRASWLNGDPEAGRVDLLESLELAREVGDSELAGRAVFNLAYSLYEDRRLDEATVYAERGIEAAERAEHLIYLRVLCTLRGGIALHRARWEEALSFARHGLELTGQVAAMAASIIDRVLLRTGREDEASLEESLRVALRLGDLPSTGFAVGATCEAAWLRGDLDTIRRVAWPVYEDACRLKHRTLPGELGYWLIKAGESPTWLGTDQPYAHLASGRWQEAAEIWAESGYPYEHALALAESPSAEDLLVALEKLDGIGAAPLAGVVRRRLRDLGVTRLPRGPLSSTRQQPAGLTQRQVEVLELLADGLSNAKIASRLDLSIRTVGNHVAAILGKLDVHRREDAVARGRAFLSV